MSIISLLVILALVGLVAWVLIKFVPMPQPIRTVIIIVAIVIAVLVALHAFGIFTGGLNQQVPHV
jgi:hypothetical protein